MIWRELEQLLHRHRLPGAGLAPYDEADYYRDYDEFMRGAGRRERRTRR